MPDQTFILKAYRAKVIWLQKPLEKVYEIPFSETFNKAVVKLKKLLDDDVEAGLIPVCNCGAKFPCNCPEVQWRVEMQEQAIQTIVLDEDGELKSMKIDQYLD